MSHPPNTSQHNRRFPSEGVPQGPVLGLQPLLILYLGIFLPGLPGTLEAHRALLVLGYPEQETQTLESG